MKHFVAENISFLTFLIEDELFAVEVIKVIEVLRNQEIYEVPKTEEYIKGIINFRGNVLTVIDTRKKINMSFDNVADDQVIIVFETELNNKKIHIGALADKVVNVHLVNEKEIKAVPEFGNYYNPEFLLGAIKVKEEFAVILDIEKILSVNEVEIISEINKNNANTI
jgi:purine-binding chemotaxis protein CheW